MITRGVGARIGVVVVAGGRGERFGGDKLAADVDGHSLLDHTLDGLPVHASIVCVGPTRPTTREVTWAREAPPFTGPLAAAGAGVRALPQDVAAVALVAGDMPDVGRVIPSLAFALAAATAASRATDTGPAAAVAVSADGQREPLVVVWWRDRLERRLAELGELAGRAVRSLLDHVPFVELAMPSAAGADVDTPTDLEAVRTERSGRPGPPGARDGDG